VRPLIEAARVQAMLHVQSSRPAADGVFVRNDTAVALLATSDWPANIAISGVQMHRQGRILVFASDAAMLQRVVSRIGAQPATASTYAARYLHSKELEPFTRMMTQMDNAATQSMLTVRVSSRRTLRASDVSSIASTRKQ
jgi:hypothetical protein